MYKQSIYNKLNHKYVAMWLGLRNEAAHGHYNDYDQQVELMLNGILNFINNVKL